MRFSNKRNQSLLEKWLILVLSKRFTRVTGRILPTQVTGSIKSTRVTSKVLEEISGGERWGNFSSVQFSQSVVSEFLQPHEMQHARPPCPSTTPRVHPNSCPLSRWCHLTISFSVVPFSHLQSFPASGSFQMRQLFASGGQNTGVSAATSVLQMNTQEWFPLGWTGCFSSQSKGLSRVFSNSTVQKHQFFSDQVFLHSKSHIHTWLLEKPYLWLAFLICYLGWS